MGKEPETNDRFWMQNVVKSKAKNRNNYYDNGQELSKEEKKKDKTAQSTYYNCLMAIANETIEQNEQNADVLKSCAYMNINKRGGQSSCNMTRLRDYSIAYKYYIQEEIRLLNPKNIIVLGNLPKETLSIIATNGIKTYTYPKHPSVYSKDKINEFVKNKEKAVLMNKSNAEKLCKTIYRKAYEIYGDNLPLFVSERIEWELRSLNDYSNIYWTSLKLVKESQNRGYITNSRASTASLLINFLLEITEVNPLAPHYVCPDCRNTELHTEAFCGVDLPDKCCEKCGALMHKDGFNIPAETYLGLDGDKPPCICLGVAPEAEEHIMNLANEYVNAENNVENNSLYIEITSDKQLSLLKKLEKLTNTKARDIPLDDKKTLELFSAKNTCGVPEFHTPFVKNIITKTDVKCFDDIVRILGFSHGMDVWDNNGETILSSTDIKLSDVISCRDDVTIYLVKKGYEKYDAFRISEKIRKGKGLSEEEFEEMLCNDIPRWYAESCNKIKYSFPRAHCVSQAMLAFRIAYYKVHYPLQFNHAYDLWSV